ncbi:hypothetical protein MLD38_009829 [Melastoma candidum]|uniref:Uncharacterized protein n=1 Tax=Melastoma candidum TaxID=119954 RepID=A0ACB9RY79_9MYRT|nr:hypothetical protein MLD38_009829 [Melastoma candidum]
MMMFLLFSSSGALDQDTDKHALLQLKSLFADGGGALSSWNDSNPLCSWTGVTCGHNHPRVVSLYLNGLSLSGSLSPYVGNLSFLRSIDLGDNSIGGEIPAEIGNLPRLQSLNLSSNNLEGWIPSNISRCSELWRVELDHNRLVGPLPVEMESLSNLKILHLSTNKLTGEIPPSFGNLSVLEEFDLLDNDMHGQVPVSLSQTRLRVFLISMNNFVGEFPPALYNLSTLNEIGLYRNNFHGNLRSDIGVLLPNLQLIVLSDNQFTGTIPASFSNASNLGTVDIVQNNFTGTIPSSFGDLHNLTWLNAWSNFLGGSSSDDGLGFLEDLSNCTKLNLLAISYNQYAGELPLSITNLTTQLQTLQLEGMMLYGRIPESMDRLIGLQWLALDGNLLSGTIPTSIGRLPNLGYLNLGDNNLTGEIPSTLGNITGLVDLYLYNNSLEGIIPSSLGNCKTLQELRLCHNKLGGEIPGNMLSSSSVLVLLNISHNSFQGPLTSDIGNLKSLVHLDVSYNKFTGEIPITIGNCLGLEELYMQGNLFDGSIPLLSGLRGLQFLDLSNNNLSGEIPGYIVSFVGLQFLNLSFNHLEGEVPSGGIFRNSSAVDIRRNRKLCSTTKELFLPPCPQKSPISNSRKGISSKYIVIATVLSCFVVALCCLGILFWLRKSNKEKKGIVNPSFGNFLLKISYRDLFMATNGFSPQNILGSGAFGCVYKGMLEMDKKTVAVKVLNFQQKGALKSFIAECEALHNIRHRNLVKIVTACSSVDPQGNEFKALVYAFMENGSLDSWLYPQIDEVRPERHLNFRQRLNIAIDVASALEYLHHMCPTSLAHCDLKPSNILLDGEMTAHLSDFGLARLLFKSGEDVVSTMSSSSSTIKGTNGYIAPEYGMGFNPSAAGDVYSFGVLLLETFTGKRPTDDMFHGERDLRNYVKHSCPERVTEILDPTMLFDGEETVMQDIKELLVTIFQVGLVCSADLPRERKNMREVASELNNVRARIPCNKEEPSSSKEETGSSKEEIVSGEDKSAVSP